MPQQTTIARALLDLKVNAITACIILPTYNESQNIKHIIDAIFACERILPDSERRSLDLHVLVVDDNSPDGTSLLVREAMESNQKIHLLLRGKKEGLGAAYIAGINHAMAEINPDVILEMDADFSHNPLDVIRLIGGIREGADFVIGSRYVKGGQLPDRWGVHRRIISFLSNLFTRTILGITGIRDCTGGFRAIRAEIMKEIDLSSLRVNGYAFQAIILHRAISSGARVVEIPIAFAERNAGKSKMTVKDLAEGGFALLRARLDGLRRPETRQASLTGGLLEGRKQGG